jgi:hypothetical protein
VAAGFSQRQIRRLFSLLNDELKRNGVIGEVYLVGGAVMCLVFRARPSTLDVDAYFKPASEVRKAAQRVAERAHVSERWLNDAVKGYLSTKGSYEPYLSLSHLNVFAARADYLLAMKCLAMRIGEEFHDLADIRYLLRYLNIESYGQASETIARFYPLKRFPQKTLYALEELLGP